MSPVGIYIAAPLAVGVASCRPVSPPKGPPPAMNRVVVSGVVRTTAGRPVGEARVVAQLVSEHVSGRAPSEGWGSCRGGLWAQREVVSSATGQFDIAFESIGPQVDACLVLRVFPPAESGLRDTTASGWRFRFEVPPRTEIPTVRVEPLVLASPVGNRPPHAQPPSTLQTDRTEYIATYRRGEGPYRTYGFTIIARYQNRTTGPLYVSYCPPRDRTPMYGIPVSDDTTEDSGYDRAWGCVGHESPIVVAPHATRLDTLRIEGPNAWDGRTNTPQGKLEGDFRLEYDVGTCHARGEVNCLLPLEERRSAPFRVTVKR